ncbi:MAG TPA: hypothetical protein VFM13_01515 [Gaiellaceae bacterium]|nr:hypothetical protein [Gaiellaceae bacterium]
MTLRLLLAGLAVALLAPVALAQGTTPKATLTQQASLFKQGKWKAMYATYTPRFRRACPYSRFVTGQRRARSLLGTNFQLRGIRVRMETRTRAVVAYRFVRNGQTIANVTFSDRDVYVKIGPRWYDQLDRASSC